MKSSLPNQADSPRRSLGEGGTPSLMPKGPPAVAQLDRASAIRTQAVTELTLQRTGVFEQQAASQIVPQAVALLPEQLAGTPIWPRAVAKLPPTYNVVRVEKRKYSDQLAKAHSLFGERLPMLL